MRAAREYAATDSGAIVLCWHCFGTWPACLVHRHQPHNALTNQPHLSELHGCAGRLYPVLVIFESPSENGHMGCTESVAFTHTQLFWGRQEAEGLYHVVLWCYVYVCAGAA